VNSDKLDQIEVKLTRAKRDLEHLKYVIGDCETEIMKLRGTPAPTSREVADAEFGPKNMPWRCPRCGRNYVVYNWFIKPGMRRIKVTCAQCGQYVKWASVNNENVARAEGDNEFDASKGW